MCTDIYFREANSFPTANCELQGYCVYYPSKHIQVQIQDFEMGGEFCPPQSQKSEKSNIIPIFEG